MPKVASSVKGLKLKGGELAEGAWDDHDLQAFTAKDGVDVPSCALRTPKLITVLCNSIGSSQR